MSEDVVKEKKRRKKMTKQLKRYLMTKEACHQKCNRRKVDDITIA